MSPAKCRPFCLVLNVLITIYNYTKQIICLYTYFLCVRVRVYVRDFWNIPLGTMAYQWILESMRWYGCVV